MAGDLNVALIMKLVDQVTGPAKQILKTVQGIGAESERVGRAGVEWSNRQLEANRGRRAALQGEMMDVVGLGGLLVGLTEPAVRAELQMAEVGKTVEFDAPDGLTVLRSEIRELVTSGGLAATAKGVSDIVAAAGRMGVVDENLPDDEKRAALLEFAESAAIMAKAFGISDNDAATSLARWRQNLGLTQAEALLLGDTVNLLGNTMATTEADILKVVTEFGNIAKQAGLAEREIGALSATLLAAGAPPEVAGTGMKNFLDALTRGESVTDRQAAVYEELGIDAVELAKRMQEDAAGGILSVVDAFEQIEPYRRGALIGDLFGQESKRAIAPLIDNAGLLRETFERTADASRLAGLMEEEYRRQTDTTFARRQRLLEYVTGLSEAIGTQLLPQLNDLMAAIMPVVSQITAWAEANPQLMQTVFALAGGLLALKAATLVAGFAFTALATPVLHVVRAGSWLLTVLPGLAGGLAKLGAVTGLGTVAKGIGAVAAVLGTISAPVWLAIAAAVAAVGAAWKYWDRITAILGGVARAIGEQLAPVFDAIGDRLAWLEPLLWPVGAAFEALGSAVGAAWTAIKDFFSGGFFDRENLTDEQFDAISAKAYNAANAVIDTIKDAFGRFFDWVVSIPDRIVDALGTISLSDFITWPEPPKWLRWLMGEEEAAAPALSQGAAFSALPEDQQAAVRTIERVLAEGAVPSADYRAGLESHAAGLRAEIAAVQAEIADLGVGRQAATLGRPMRESLAGLQEELEAVEAEMADADRRAAELEQALMVINDTEVRPEIDTTSIDEAMAKAARLARLLSNPGGTAAAPVAEAEGARDAGGPVRAGMPYLVGERGRELFVPGVSGAILPARALKAAVVASAMAAPALPAAALAGNADAIAQVGVRAPVSVSAPSAALAPEVAGLLPAQVLDAAGTALAMAAPAAGLAGDRGMIERIDRRPALAPPPAAPQITRQGDTINITIAPAPGMDAGAIARAVRRELDRRQDARRGDLHDGVDY